MVVKFSRIFVICFLVFVCPVQANILLTKHNLSSSAPTDAPGNTIYSSTENRICVFCHTPHNSEQETPLWNHDTSLGSYTMYASRSLNYDPTAYPVPTGSSKLCLSCHDGTVAVGAFTETLEPVLKGTNPDGTISSPTSLSTDLSDDHPISIPVKRTPELWAPEQDNQYTTSAVRLENNLVQCSSCHDAHTSNDKFLVMSADYGALCQECHHQDGWGESAHGDQSGPAGLAQWTDPGTGETKTVAKWACTGCHDMHKASEQELLQSDGDPTGSKLEEVCYRCHNGWVAPDISGEFTKLTSHPVQNPSYDSIHYPTELNPPTETHVECSDCHDPHYGQAGNRVLGDDLAGGMLRGIKAPQVGPDAPYTFLGNAWTPPTYGPVHEITYEYELCYKCHGTVSSMDLTENHQEHIDVYFNPLNQATHGVMKPGKMPKTLKAYTTFSARFQAEVPFDKFSGPNFGLACSDCHGNDDATSNISGPHGSGTNWLLRGSPEGFICYLCHEYEVYAPGGLSGSLSRFPYHTKTGHSSLAQISYPEGVDFPRVGCLACHGDFSKVVVEGYTAGGLHGANHGNQGFPNKNSTGYHFLNGFALYFETAWNESATQVSCGDVMNTSEYGNLGCNHHDSTHREPYDYTRGSF